ncbi:Veg family protein [Paraclostridium ghonii]|uniref:Uncharacterized protein Veg n=1 Tax=Paraclostridium ghonii TaxID=29358 RepID=A0ABU0N1T6_9FIRM|nr:Veg family protein [Paeniclostridium ghonii]MCM0167522.1 Veg family protein [Paeniclostridium ghonii]MDQ0557090.1 uncharacterized protein Veg [Paeniclostridium ghonii]
MATVQTLNKIRQTLEKHLGRKILLKANKGRKQIVTKKGVLEKVYPSIFVVKLDDEDNNGYSRVSYSYSDLLTDNVKLKVIKETNKLNVS